MKHLTIILLFFIPAFLHAQCTADAGTDSHYCSETHSIQLGGNPTASGGTGPYTYEWWIDPIYLGVSSKPYIYASDILDDTTIANPILSYYKEDSLTFFVRVTDSLGCQDVDTVIFTFSHFGYHLFYWTYYINPGDSVYLNEVPNIGGGYGNYTFYDWNPSHGLSDTNLASGFWAKPDSSIFYTATVTDTKGCTKTALGATYFIYIVTGIDDAESTDISVFPNPTEDYLRIEVKDNQPLKEVLLFNNHGQEVPLRLLSTDRYDISHLPVGIYNLVVCFENAVARKKIVKVN